jgi:hypothetical protein
MGLSVFPPTSMAGLGRVQYLTSSQTWTHPDGASPSNPKPIYILMTGGGGGGGAGVGGSNVSTTSYFCAGGQGGGSGFGLEQYYFVTGSVSVTIGAAGSANGGGGGTTSFGSFSTPGGSGGSNGSLYTSTTDLYAVLGGSAGACLGRFFPSNSGTEGYQLVPGGSHGGPSISNNSPNGNQYSGGIIYEGQNAFGQSTPGGSMATWNSTNPNQQLLPKNNMPINIKPSSFVAGGGGMGGSGTNPFSNYTATASSGGFGFFGTGGSGGNGSFLTSGTATGSAGTAATGYGAGGGGGGAGVTKSGTGTGGSGSAGTQGVVIVYY